MAGTGVTGERSYGDRLDDSGCESGDGEGDIVERYLLRSAAGTEKPKAASRDQGHL